jgi:hypothetical protein
VNADNQQERLETAGWVTGFVDGEGCFSITIQKNPTTSSGWQVFPEFVVTQGAKSLKALQILQEFFGCGRIFVNRRKDDHQENLYRFCVRAINDLRSKIVPFFKEHPLRTAKLADFDKFCSVLEMMQRGKHLEEQGRQEIAAICQTMNRRKRPMFLKSSETVCQTPRPQSESGQKIQSELRSDTERVAEMPTPFDGNRAVGE